MHLNETSALRALGRKDGKGVSAKGPLWGSSQGKGLFEGTGAITDFLVAAKP